MGQKISVGFNVATPYQTNNLISCHRITQDARKRNRQATIDTTRMTSPRLEFLLEKYSSSSSFSIHRDDTDNVLRLENAWNPNDCSSCIRIRKADPLTFRRLPVQHTTDAIRGKVAYERGLHVWSIRWRQEERGTNAVIGVATSEAPLRGFGYKCLVGNNEDSWGWDIVKNKLWHNGKSSHGLINTSPTSNVGLFNITDRSQLNPPSPSMVIPDEILVILDMEEGTLAFASGQQYLGVAFRDLKGRKLFPIVSAVWGYCQVTMTYIGGIEPVPFSLSEICRQVIRRQLGKNRLSEINKLPLPPLLLQLLR